jgi:hypothetical protein
MLFVYGPVIPATVAGESRRRRRRRPICALRGGRAAQRAASASLLCHLSVF